MPLPGTSQSHHRCKSSYNTAAVVPHAFARHKPESPQMQDLIQYTSYGSSCLCQAQARVTTDVSPHTILQLWFLMPLPGTSQSHHRCKSSYNTAAVVPHAFARHKPESPQMQDLIQYCSYGSSCLCQAQARVTTDARPHTILQLWFLMPLPGTSQSHDRCKTSYNTAAVVPHAFARHKPESPQMQDLIQYTSCGSSCLCQAQARVTTDVSPHTILQLWFLMPLPGTSQSHHRCKTSYNTVAMVPHAFARHKPESRQMQDLIQYCSCGSSCLCQAQARVTTDARPHTILQMHRTLEKYKV